MERIRQGIRLEYLSLGWMTIEVIGSLGMGLILGSLALLAFGGDSLVEIVSGFAVTLHLREDSSGSDDLGKQTETLTKFLLLALIPIIGGSTLYSYLVGLAPESSLLGIAVALGAVVVMPVLWIQKRKIGRETNCAPLSIDAVQSGTCFLMSFALLGGLLINYLLGIGWVDYVATALILVFIAREGETACFSVLGIKVISERVLIGDRAFRTPSEPSTWRRRVPRSRTRILVRSFIGQSCLFIEGSGFKVCLIRESREMAGAAYLV